MASKQIIKSWNEDEVTLMSLYEMDLHHPEAGLPKFGSDLRLEVLRDARLDTFQQTLGEGGGYSFSKRGNTIRDSSTLPTPLNLAWHFRYTTWGLDLLRMAAGPYRGQVVDFTRILLRDAEDRFFHDHVKPLRYYLEWKWQIYFYCIPATFLERQLMGGTGGLRSGGPLVLSLLPKFPHVALDRGEQEARVRLLAGQVLWLVRSHLCVNRKITGEEKQDLIEVITAWRNYVTPFHFMVELDRIQQNNPYLITEELRDTLLPEGAFELLRLPA